MPAAALSATKPIAYERHRPETTALYELVRDNLETLYGAIDDGALGVKLPKHAKKELDGFTLHAATRAGALVLRGGANGLTAETAGDQNAPALNRAEGSRRCVDTRGKLG